MAFIFIGGMELALPTKIFLIWALGALGMWASKLPQKEACESYIQFVLALGWFVYGPVKLGCFICYLWQVGSFIKSVPRRLDQ